MFAFPDNTDRQNAIKIFYGAEKITAASASATRRW
jgi:hypothetical protein